MLLAVPMGEEATEMRGSVHVQCAQIMMSVQIYVCTPG